MKKSILTFSLLVLMASFSSAIAQQSGIQEEKQLKTVLSPAQRAEKRTAKMTKSLDLSKKQEKEIYNINLQHAEAEAKLRAERIALKAKYKAERNLYSEKVDNTLTQEQKEKLMKLKAKKAEQRSKHKHPKPPVPPATNR